MNAGRRADVTPERATERVVAGRALRAVERAFRRLDGPFGAIPRDLDPMAQTGAVANVAMLVAVVTGILLLFWYVPSVNRAYESVSSMAESPWTAELVRSLHRYSSDACIFFVLVHWARMVAERRFGGARWVAWITGVFGVSLLWFVGWTGYWLIWDQAAQEVAIGTARLLDVVPIFADPLSRTFLTDDGINPLIFFLVFFTHMLLPLGVGVAIWLHISRLRRSKFLTSRRLAAYIVLTLVAVSIAFPAPLGDAAAMLTVPRGFPLDAWYLAPIALTERLAVGALWSLLLVSGLLLYAVPWVFVRGRATPAVVDPAKCDECLKCVRDCPYGAIAMVPRAGDNGRRPTVALVDPTLCVGCGICAGSCDSAGIGLDWMPAPTTRLRVDAWVTGEEEADVIVYVCEPSRRPDLRYDPVSGYCPELPGSRIVEVPCAGWVHPLTVERALRKGASGVLIVGCPDGACVYREGGATTEQRMEGAREPALRVDRVDPTRVRVLREAHVSVGRIAEVADALRRGERPPPRRLPPIAAAIVGITAALGLTVALSNVPYRTPYASDPEVVVSIKHAGEVSDVCRDRTPEELAALPPHMRRPQVCERGRAAVHVRVSVDDSVVHTESFEAPGVSNDGIATGIIRVRPGRGGHTIRVDVGDSADAEEFQYSDTITTDLPDRARVVARFERGSFSWYGND